MTESKINDREQVAMAVQGTMAVQGERALSSATLSNLFRKGARAVRL